MPNGPNPANYSEAEKKLENSKEQGQAVKSISTLVHESWDYSPNAGQDDVYDEEDKAVGVLHLDHWVVTEVRHVLLSLACCVLYVHLGHFEISKVFLLL